MASGAKNYSIASDELNLTSLEYAKHSQNAIFVGGIPWEKYNGILTPLCVPHVPIDVDRDELRRALDRNKMLLALWTTHWESFSDSQWWWVVCDIDEYDVTRVESSRGRSSIRRGLRSCVVRRLRAGDFISLSYPLHKAALERYGVDAPDENQYAEEIMALGRNPGNHFWGAFVEEQMAAYLFCRVMDGVCRTVTGAPLKELNKYNPMAAMFYTVSKYYLDKDLNYVTNGWRTLLHDTSMNDFLETLGFRKVFCKVNIELSPLAKIINSSHLIKWGAYLRLNRLSSERWRQLEAFSRLVKIFKTFDKYSER